MLTQLSLYPSLPDTCLDHHLWDNNYESHGLKAALKIGDLQPQRQTLNYKFHSVSKEEKKL